MKYAWKPLAKERCWWVWSDNSKDRPDHLKVGYLRGDFGKGGNEFWTSWFGGVDELKTTDFIKEFNDVVNNLRQAGNFLHSRRTMRNVCGDCFEWQMETAEHIYCMRCNPNPADYNFYIYVYVKEE